MSCHWLSDCRIARVRRYHFLNRAAAASNRFLGHFGIHTRGGTPVFPPGLSEPHPYGSGSRTQPLPSSTESPRGNRVLPLHAANAHHKFFGRPHAALESKPPPRQAKRIFALPCRGSPHEVAPRRRHYRTLTRHPSYERFRAHLSIGGGTEFTIRAFHRLTPLEIRCHALMGNALGRFRPRGMVDRCMCSKSRR